MRLTNIITHVFILILIILFKLINSDICIGTVIYSIYVYMYIYREDVDHTIMVNNVNI